MNGSEGISGGVDDGSEELHSIYSVPPLLDTPPFLDTLYNNTFN
jgi:hypothetical protein